MKRRGVWWKRVYSVFTHHTRYLTRSWGGVFQRQACCVYDLETFCTWIGLLWVVVFYDPSTARSFRDGIPIYCSLSRTRSSFFTPFSPGIEPRDSLLYYRCGSPASRIGRVHVDLFPPVFLLNDSRSTIYIFKGNGPFNSPSVRGFA